MPSSTVPSAGTTPTPLKKDENKSEGEMVDEAILETFMTTEFDKHMQRLQDAKKEALDAAASA